MSETDNQDQYRYVPYAEQEGPQKIHRIHLEVDRSDEHHSEEKLLVCDERCSCGSTRLRIVAQDFPRGWGDGVSVPRLEYVVPNAMMYCCECGVTVGMALSMFLAIEAKAEIIVRAFEFPGEKNLQRLEEAFPPDDVKKVREFAKAIDEMPLVR